MSVPVWRFKGGAMPHAGNVQVVGTNHGTTSVAPSCSAGQAEIDDVIDLPGHVAGYVYDGDGRRVGITEPDDGHALTLEVASTKQLWDLSGPMPMLLFDGTRDYWYGPGGRPVMQSGSGAVTEWLHLDQLGSVRMLTNAAGLPTARYDYDPWGNVVTEAELGTDPDDPSYTIDTDFETQIGGSSGLRFAGQYLDRNTGHYYLRARYYDPATGQFLTRDPIESITRDAYGYAVNNPTNFTDPTGLAPWDLAADLWDATGGRAVTWVSENPGTAVSIVGAGFCATLSLGVCGVAVTVAFASRSAERFVDVGFHESLAANLTDGVVTWATFGLVSVPAGLGVMKGGRDAVTGLFTAGQRGIMHGAPFWQQAAARSGGVAADLGGLFAGWWATPRPGYSAC